MERSCSERALQRKNKALRVGEFNRTDAGPVQLMRRTIRQKLLVAGGSLQDQERMSVEEGVGDTAATAKAFATARVTPENSWQNSDGLGPTQHASKQGKRSSRKGGNIVQLFH